MKVYDLTHTIQNDMPVYPGTEQPKLTTACTIEAVGYRETLLHMFSHTGTHMDAPAHMLLDGAALDSYPGEKFAGTAVVVDCRERRASPFPCCKAMIWTAWTSCCSAPDGIKSGAAPITTRASPV